ncbi:hypothetical protein ACNFX6_06430 [Acinetobacter johnsonii]|uniref:DUF3850 domain-containing protein n=1 Tax=Acinetobacter johnsonii TaxID=40214 RepID=A0AAW6RSE5_ACIJO|nr:hypothetical protein [Acinetobacter johnsonii]MDG9785903.1 hypothetical protein [Acinetobacter johnsonii]MDG9797838.1 hypothetical protein [Acinetobacter johnsonii]HRB83246.1 hypothetical protein [Acinetobacter johnsonii]
MDLIEQLGGYERAKDGLHRLKLEKKDLLTCGDLIVVESEIDAALLEYRRQHNIFEVGDKVVVKDHPFWPEDYVILTVEQEHIGKWYMSAWRHATDAEIKAGKRLEVKSEN